MEKELDYTDYYTNKVYGKELRFTYNASNSYKEVNNPQEWLDCPNCGKKPLVWEFNNGRNTACGCGENKYDHFSIHAESLMSVISNSDTGKDATDYKVDDLKDNWNHWVKNKEILFPHASQRNDDRW